MTLRSEQLIAGNLTLRSEQSIAGNLTLRPFTGSTGPVSTQCLLHAVETQGHHCRVRAGFGH